MVNANEDDTTLARLIRIETRLSKLMRFFGINPATGELDRDHQPRTPYEPDRQRRTRHPYQR